MVDRGVWAGVVLAMMLVAEPAAGLQDGDVPGHWLVEPGEVVEWKLSLPWNLKVGGLAGRFWVEFKKNYGYLRGKRYGHRYGYGLGGSRSKGSRSKPRARGMPARLVRVETMRVLLDGEPYLTIRDPTTDSLTLDFPYPVRELELRVGLSEGSSLGVRVRLPERHRELARGVDFRKGLYLEGPRWPHEGPFFVAPLREGDGWIRPGKWGCLTRPELGRVRLAASAGLRAAGAGRSVSYYLCDGRGRPAVSRADCLRDGPGAAAGEGVRGGADPRRREAALWPSAGCAAGRSGAGRNETSEAARPTVASGWRAASGGTGKHRPSCPRRHGVCSAGTSRAVRRGVAAATAGAAPLAGAA